MREPDYKILGILFRLFVKRVCFHVYACNAMHCLGWGFRDIFGHGGRITFGIGGIINWKYNWQNTRSSRLFARCLFANVTDGPFDEIGTPVASNDPDWNEPQDETPEEQAAREEVFPSNKRNSHHHLKR